MSPGAIRVDQASLGQEDRTGKERVVLEKQSFCAVTQNNEERKPVDRDHLWLVHTTSVPMIVTLVARCYY